MVKIKLYLSMIIVLLSTMIGTNILLQEDKKIESIEYKDSIGYVVEEFTSVTTPTSESTTSTSTTTTTTTSTTTITTSTTKKTTTTSNIQIASTVNNKTINNGNYMTVSGSDKKYKLKKDDGSRKLMEGNSYAMMDYRFDFNNDKNIIYAHSNKEGTGLFQFFQNYDGNKSFYDNHKYITINYDGKTYNYEIFSVYIEVLNSTENSNEYFMNYTYADHSKFVEVLVNYKNNSQYNTNVNISDKDKILIIQTCSMNPNYRGRANLLVMAKLV